MKPSMSPQEARQLALAFLDQAGLNREFVENASLKPDDAEILVQLCPHKRPEKILEVGTFVGVSSVVLSLCFPDSEMICVDPGLPTGLMNGLCVRKFEIPDYPQTMLSFVEAALTHVGVRDRVKIYQGFFSCCFPDKGDRQNVTDYGVNLDHYATLGPEVCQTHSPFDVVFLDADHHTEAVLSDLLLLASHLATDGAIILHDMGEDFWGQQVREGVRQFLKVHPEFSLEQRGDLGKLQRS
ncbi:class I SAM-dependent methyltransferase [Roseofilum capinflatum]|uniref:Class I SAM-dependent methyltransferase n=1 Tax=Roseofilum capinflatum BLCC-M114 TaxID=3022440 RepID=A0ABT7B724_9CYAN|nr:class I SAM-dependent methyltransferase [Roseofilum capinflatum]MDJ1174974.1 class I SAM-dependent methyltransferase [Roseofilum capinflatum BLCC-M114]